MNAIETPAALYAHAIAMEREAAARYAEFAQRMLDEGRKELAELFGRLQLAEAEHLLALERRAEGVALPPLDRDRYSWLYSGAPETPARELVFRLMTPRQALAIALHAEQRAHAFFEHVYWAAQDPALRALAREMMAEEREHAALLARALEATPTPSVAGTVIFER